MPTRPLLELLDRDFAVVASKQITDLACPLLQELVNYGTLVWRRCDAEASKEPENENVAPMILYLHLLEQIDGIEVLVRSSCASAAIPLLRSSFEAQLGLEYLLESRSHVRLRSLAWLAWYAKERLRGYDRIDPSTRDDEANTSILDDDIANKVQWPSEETMKRQKRPLTDLLARAQFSDVIAEFGKRPRPRNWYSLFGGPSHLLGLASHLRRGAQYQLLYRRWSAVSHAEDMSRFIVTGRAKQGALWPLRNPAETRNVCVIACVLMLRATRDMLRHYRPEESLLSWYSREVRGPFLRLVSLDVELEPVG